ncbi:hypothetical protein DFJ77DRAFT_476705 [Powellomyces hirtus]|nr:hypothetical protein DFJ77DRAFT_476705 [Powellomyces hirtus]
MLQGRPGLMPGKEPDTHNSLATHNQQPAQTVVRVQLWEMQQPPPIPPKSMPVLMPLVAVHPATPDTEIESPMPISPIASETAKSNPDWHDARATLSVDNDASEEEAELAEMPASPASSTGGILHRRSRPVKRTSRSRSRDVLDPETDRLSTSSPGTSLDDNDQQQSLHDQSLLVETGSVLTVEPSTASGHSSFSESTSNGEDVRIVQTWADETAHIIDGVTSPRSFILTEEGVELGQSTVMDMPMVQSAQEVFTVNIPAESSEPVQVSKSVAVTLENGETFVVQSDMPEASTVTVSIPAPTHSMNEPVMTAEMDADIAVVRSASPTIPPRSLSPRPIAVLSKPLPPLPTVTAESGILPATHPPAAMSQPPITHVLTPQATIPIPVRTASKMPVSGIWMQPTPAVDPKIAHRPSLFKKRPTVDDGSAGESAGGSSSDEARPSRFPSKPERSLSSDGSTDSTFAPYSPRASVEAVMDHEGVIESLPDSSHSAHNLRSGSVRSLFRKRPGTPNDMAAGESSRDHSPLSPAHPLSKEAVSADAQLYQVAIDNEDRPLAHSDDVPLSSSPSASLTMAEMLAPPTAQQIAEIVGPAMQSLQQHQSDPLGPGVYSVVPQSAAILPHPAQNIPVSQAFVEAGFGSRTMPASGRVSHYVPRSHPAQMGTSTGGVVIAPRISSLGTARREEVSRKRFTYLGGDNLSSAYLNSVQAPAVADTPYIPPDPREIATCPLCADVCERAVRLSCCENVCCSSCIWRWLAHRKSCPFCRSRFAPENVSPANDVQEVIDRLTVKCKEPGCDWEGMRSHLKEHVKAECHGTLGDNKPPNALKQVTMAPEPPTTTHTKQRPMSVVRRRSSDHFHSRCPPSIRNVDTITALNRSPSNSRRILIPIRSAHPRIMFRRISAYGKGGFIRPIHSTISSPCIGIPPRISSAAVGKKLILPPLEGEQDEGEVVDDALPPITSLEGDAAPQRATEPERVGDTAVGVQQPPIGGLYRKRTSTHSRRLSRSMSLTSRRSTYRRSMDRLRTSTSSRTRSGITSWDLIEGEEETQLAHQLQQQHRRISAHGQGTFGTFGRTLATRSRLYSAPASLTSRYSVADISVAADAPEEDAEDVDEGSWSDIRSDDEIEANDARTRDPQSDPLVNNNNPARPAVPES